MWVFLNTMVLMHVRTKQAGKVQYDSVLGLESRFDPPPVVCRNLHKI